MNLGSKLNDSFYFSFNFLNIISHNSVLCREKKYLKMFEIV